VAWDEESLLHAVVRDVSRKFRGHWCVYGVERHRKAGLAPFILRKWRLKRQLRADARGETADTRLGFSVFSTSSCSAQGVCGARKLVPEAMGDYAAILSDVTQDHRGDVYLQRFNALRSTFQT